MPVVTDYTSLLSGDYWNGIEVTGQPIIVTFSFPTSFPANLLPSDLTELGFTSSTAATFTPFTPAEQAQALAALNQWAAASGLVFIQVAPGQGQINFSNVDFNTTSYAGSGGIGFYPFGQTTNSFPYYAGPTPTSGEIFMNSQYQNATDGTVNLGTMLHEIGHAIGLKHPTEVVGIHNQVLSSNDPSQTIMATVGEVGAGSSPAQLKPLDQQAAAFLYGPAGTGGVYTSDASGSNSLVNWSWDASTQTLTQTALVGSADIVIHGTSVNNIIDASQNSGNDQLFGYGGATNTLYAGSGNDKLYGGTGTNTLVGGSGSDTFYVDSAATTVTAQSSGTNTNTAYSTVNFTLPANVTTLYLTGNGLTGTANNQGDSIYADPTYGGTIIGGSGTDYLFANGPGNTQIYAGNGTANFYGGSGTDLLVGGTGTNYFNVFGAATTVEAKAGAVFNGVYSSVSFTASANVNYLAVFGSNLTATGNGQNDQVFGDPTNATKIIGGSGYDYLVGGSGNDTIIAGVGTDLIYGGLGSNTFVFKSLTAAPVGGSSYTTIGDFKDGVDKIDLSAITAAQGVNLSFIGTAPFTGHAGQVHEVAYGGNTLLEADFTGAGVADFEILLFGTHSLVATDLTPACYCKGTLIETAKGEVPVECLAIGDEVMTKSGAARPIKWIGRRSYGGRFIMGAAEILPICIKGGALHDNVPRRDLWISPHHAMYLEGVLIEARDLVNGVSIVQAEGVEKVEYFHIELETHDVIVAEGAMSESFIDDDSRAVFHNVLEYGKLYPDEPSGPASYCAPRFDAGYEVEAARRNIDVRAGLRAGGELPAPLRGYIDEVSSRRIAGWAQNVEHLEAPVCLDIYAGNQLIGQVLANRYRADLKRAGLGSGHHSFDFTPSTGLTFVPQAIEVRRSLDGAALCRSHDPVDSHARAVGGNR